VGDVRVAVGKYEKYRICSDRPIRVLSTVVQGKAAPVQQIGYLTLDASSESVAHDTASLMFDSSGCAFL
jgi:hypothetical protein